MFPDYEFWRAMERIATGHVSKGSPPLEGAEAYRELNKSLSVCKTPQGQWNLEKRVAELERWFDRNNVPPGGQKAFQLSHMQEGPLMISVFPWHRRLHKRSYSWAREFHGGMEDHNRISRDAAFHLFLCIEALARSQKLPTLPHLVVDRILYFAFTFDVTGTREVLMAAYPQFHGEVGEPARPCMRYSKGCRPSDTMPRKEPKAKVMPSDPGSTNEQLMAKVMFSDPGSTDERMAFALLTVPSLRTPTHWPPRTGWEAI